MNPCERNTFQRRAAPNMDVGEPLQDRQFTHFRPKCRSDDIRFAAIQRAEIEASPKPPGVSTRLGNAQQPHQAV